MTRWYDAPEARLVLSLALGLLFGIERERRNVERGGSSIAGLRTFGLAGLLGGLLEYAGNPVITAIGAVFVGAFALAGYVLDPKRDLDRGITSEIALFSTYVLGALALEHPQVATAATIIATTLLAFRAKLHGFVRDAMSESELHDGLLFLVLVFVALPLTPDVAIGPYHAINPQRIVRVVSVVTALSAFGYVAQRTFGSRHGLIASGFAGGFVSSSATIAAMGMKAKVDPTIRSAAVAGSLASSVSTLVLYEALVIAVDPVLAQALAVPLGFGLLACVTGIVVAVRRSAPADIGPPRGRAFEWKPAALVAIATTVVSIANAWFDESFGSSGVILVSAVAGFVDAHATAGSVATLRHGNAIPVGVATHALLAALSTNSVTKIVLARAGGDNRFAVLVAIGVLAIAAAAWAAHLGLAALGAR